MLILKRNAYAKSLKTLSKTMLSVEEVMKNRVTTTDNSLLKQKKLNYVNENPNPILAF